MIAADKYALQPGEQLGWKPNTGPQEKYLHCSAREALYGGAAGGGKTDALLMDAVRHYQNRRMRSILFRRTFPMLAKIIDRSKQIYPLLGGRYNESKHIWKFPAGGQVRLSNLDKYDQVYNYQGDDFTFIGFDELTQWASSAEWDYMISRLRTTTDSGIKILKMRGATNPGGRGHHWVKERFAISDAGDSSAQIVKETGFRRVFIPSRLKDNPFLAGTDYEKMLLGMPPMLRKALLEGRWDIIAGAMFDIWDPRDFTTEGGHVCTPFDIPSDAEIWRGGDDGFNAPACVLWFWKRDGRTFIIDELYSSGMSPAEMAEKITKRDAFWTSRRVSGVFDPAAWADTGMGNSQGNGRAQIMNANGCRWDQAEKGPNSRVAGVSLVYSTLKKKLADGKPELVVFKTCKNLIRTLPALPRDEDNIEDVDTEAEDHAYDALRYGLQYKKREIRQGKLTGL